jgi:hypothetical protein
MNLQGITAGAVGAVNPFITAQIKASTGYATAADGTQVPTYAAPANVQIQVQALQYNDIVQLDGLNIQGDRRAVYLQGDWNGIIRADKKGGDLLIFPRLKGGPNETWLVVFIFENWIDWTKCAVTLQNIS